MIKLRKMNQEEFETFSKYSIEHYADDLIKSGMETEEKAYEKSVSGFHQMQPDGLQTNDNYLYVIENENVDIGWIWYQKYPKDNTCGFICDFLIFDEHKRKGYGKETLKTIEEDAKNNTIKKLALNVFKHNPNAYTLYLKMGYKIIRDNPSNTIMEKEI